MSTANIRQQLQNYLEVADDKKVKAIYTMMEDEIKEANIAYSDELKAELDKRYASYKSGKSKIISAKESKKRINNLLNKQKTHLHKFVPIPRGGEPLINTIMK